MYLRVALLVLSTGSALAQSSGGEFEITRSTTDAGGGSSLGSTFELTGSVAQPEANFRPSVGGEFVLGGGFWATGTDLLFSNGFEE